MSDEPTPTGAEIQDTPAAAETQVGPSDAQSQESGERTYTQADLDKALEARLGRQKKSLMKKFEQELQAKTEETLNAWREEKGLSDEALDKFQSLDKNAHEMRLLKTEATKAANALSKEVERVNALEAALRAEKVDKAILAAASGKANNPSEIVSLLKASVSFDGTDAFVADSEGEPTGQTIEEFVDAYLEKNDHHKRPTAPRGAGSMVRSPGGAPDGGPLGTDRESRIAALRKVFG